MACLLSFGRRVPRQFPGWRCVGLPANNKRQLGYRLAGERDKQENEMMNKFPGKTPTKEALAGR